MPELPEVETIRIIVQKQVRGLTINSVDVHNSCSLNRICEDDFVVAVTGSVIRSIDRRGKYFIFNLSSGTMVLHLRMDGQLYVVNDADHANRYTLLSFNLSDGSVLRFDDKRKFAKASFIPDGVEDTVSGVSKLGLEPFGSNLTAEYLRKKWRSSFTTIKEALLDQTIIAGFGNFYSDDLLFICGINPKKKCAGLTVHNYESIAKMAPKVIDWGISLDRVTEEEYTKIGEHGFNAKNHSYVYGRSGMPCKVCGDTIRSFKFGGGRTCCYCPSCQHTVKFLSNDLNSDMFDMVLRYIGSWIRQFSKFETYFILSNKYDTSGPETIRWDNFVMCVYESIMTEDVVSIEHDSSWGFRMLRARAIGSMSDVDREEGLVWLKSKNWLKRKGGIQMDESTFISVARYIGERLIKNGEVSSKELVNVEPEDVTWEEFVRKVDDLMCMGFIIPGNDKLYFDKGVQWLKQQNWRK